MSAFDQSGNVGHDEGSVHRKLDDAQVGILGRERIVGDLRPGARHPAEQRALAGVRFADQADVSDYLQLQDDSPPLPFAAWGRLAWSAIGRRFEGIVPPAAASSAGDDDALSFAR